jgi:hypothetical protein
MIKICDNGHVTGVKICPMCGGKAGAFRVGAITSTGEKLPRVSSPRAKVAPKVRPRYRRRARAGQKNHGHDDI